MTNIELIKAIIKGAGVNKYTPEKEEKAVKYLEDTLENETECIADLAALKDSDIKEMFSVAAVSCRKITSFIVDEVKRQTKADEPKLEELELPDIPQDMSSMPDLQVSGNTAIDVKGVMTMINFTIMYGLGTEGIGENLVRLIHNKIEERDEQVTPEIINVFKTAAKFKDLNNALTTALDFDLSLVANRHVVAGEVIEGTKKAVVSFIGTALGVRSDLSDFNSILLKNTLSAHKVDKQISTDEIEVASSELIIDLNKTLRGFNHMTVEASLALYNELYDHLDNTELHKFLGVRDREELLTRLHVKLSPKDVAGLKKLPVLMYQILHVIEHPEILSNSTALYTYLQKIWSSRSTVAWARFGSITTADTKPITKAEQAVVANKSTDSKESVVHL